VTSRSVATGTIRAGELAALAEQVLRPAADPERAGPMRAYMRGQFAYLGIPSPKLKQLIRAMAVPKPLSEKQLRETALKLWRLPEREFQYVAVALLRRDAKLCGPGFLATARDLIVAKSWWDTVDELAVHVVGVLVRQHPELVSTMDEWLTGDNLWLSRTAILHQNGWKTQTDPQRLFRYCVTQAGHPDFFIRKAIGWALRDYAWTEPEAVRQFVAANAEVLSGLSKREALKNIG
jgi:3-methyladenine DNA glycosylase AlkD